MVVDDGSTDDTATIIAHNYNDERRLRYFWQKNQGVAAARNYGLRNAKGEFIAFLDSDDIWEPWKLELQIRAMRFAPKICMVLTDMTAINPDGAVVSTSYLRKMYRAYRYFSLNDLFSEKYSLNEVAPELSNLLGNYTFYIGNIFSKMIMGNMVHTSTVMFRSRILDAVNGFNESLKISGEDYDFHLRTCMEGPVGFIDIPSIKYQIDIPDQLTHSPYSLHMAQNFLRTIEPIIKSDLERIDLSEKMISSVQAYAYQWIGTPFLCAGDNRKAVEHFKKSVFYRPMNPVTWIYLILSVMPRSV